MSSSKDYVDRESKKVDKEIIDSGKSYENKKILSTIGMGVSIFFGLGFVMSCLPFAISMAALGGYFYLKRRSADTNRKIVRTELGNVKNHLTKPNVNDNEELNRRRLGKIRTLNSSIKKDEESIKKMSKADNVLKAGMIISSAASLFIPFMPIVTAGLFAYDELKVRRGINNKTREVETFKRRRRNLINDMSIISIERRNNRSTVQNTPTNSVDNSKSNTDSKEVINTSDSKDDSNDLDDIINTLKTQRDFLYDRYINYKNLYLGAVRDGNKNMASYYNERMSKMFDDYNEIDNEIDKFKVNDSKDISSHK